MKNCSKLNCHTQCWLTGTSHHLRCSGNWCAEIKTGRPMMNGHMHLRWLDVPITRRGCFQLSIPQLRSITAWPSPTPSLQQCALGRVEGMHYIWSRPTTTTRRQLVWMEWFKNPESRNQSTAGFIVIPVRPSTSGSALPITASQLDFGWNGWLVWSQFEFR